MDTQGRGEPASDAELVRASVGGDRNSFAALYDRYADGVYDFCTSVLRDRDDAADAMQDTFLIAAVRLNQLRDPDRVRPWLYSIARNESLRRARARARVGPDSAVTEVADTSTSPEEAAQQSALQKLVWDAAAGLSDRDRSLLDLHLRQGLEGADLGRALGTSAEHAYVLLNRLRTRVERTLGAFLVARLGRDDCNELAAPPERLGWTLLAAHPQARRQTRRRMRRLLRPKKGPGVAIGAARDGSAGDGSSRAA